MLLAVVIVLFVSKSHGAPTWENDAAIFNGVEWQHLLELEPPFDAAPTPPVGDSYLRNDTSLFVNIAAFRDGERSG